MKDQYSFLKAIDTSSSSPELLSEAEAALRRSRQKPAPHRQLQPLKLSIKQSTAQSNGLTPTATTNSSSSINSKTQAKLKGNILTNLVRPIKFHSQPQQQPQQQQVSTAMRKSQTEKPETSDLRDRLFLLTTGKQQHLKSSAKLLGAPRLSQPPVAATAAPVPIRSHTSRHHHVPQSSYQNTKTTSSGVVKSPLNYLPSETATQTQQSPPELGRCYDEIDQIYDYIRGLAPLPVNLRKIKSIDFEQLERDRQKLAERQQTLQVQHHQHRERYVRSIDDSTSHSASVSSSQQQQQQQQQAPSLSTKRLVRVRQRDASDQNSVRPPPPLLPVASGQVAPLPIRVTTRASESARPSIKRVESLNLGQQRPEKAATEHVADQNSTGPRRQVKPPMTTTATTTTTTTTGLTKPSYLISRTQRGQVFRLPRAHSTSTLNKPAIVGGTGGRRASQAIAAGSKEPVILESLPLARLAVGRRHLEPGFESDLVESFVDDDETVESGRQQVATREDEKCDSRSSSSSSSGSSSTSSEEEDDDEDGAKSVTGSSSSSQASERLSQKSHSDYDNDSDANTSETTTETSSETTTTNTSNDEKNDEDKLEQVRARARALKREHQHHGAGKTSSSSMSPFSGAGVGGGGSSTGKRSQRPTTSSSPSSGRPASPADETQPESDGPEATSIGRGESTQRRKSASSSSFYRHQMPLSSNQPARREEHIYEQIPAHRTRELVTTTPRVLCADHPIGMPTTTSQSTLTRQAPGGAQKTVIKHPVAYAANVAVNRRYQQQVAALFALQQQRDRQLAASQPPVAPQLLHQGHRRRASASNTQFLPQWRQATNSSSNHRHRSHHNDHHDSHHLSSVPHRHRLSMGNIHLLTSAIPLASLYSPKTTRNVPLLSSGEAARAKEERHRRRSQANANSLDDHEAGSTGTTNSTSSYEAAIKNSEPNPLRIDMLAQTLDGSPEQRHSAGRRSVGSGSGSRSLSNHLQMHNVSTHHLHQQQQQQQQQHSSSLVKVPKLSKQSHLLQRPLPKPPNHHRSSSSSKQPASKSTNRTTTTRPPPAVDVFN